MKKFQNYYYDRQFLKTELERTKKYFLESERNENKKIEIVVQLTKVTTDFLMSSLVRSINFIIIKESRCSEYFKNYFLVNVFDYGSG